MKRWLILVLFGFVAMAMIFPATAQGDDLTPYSWDAADMALAYPTAWDSPIPAEQDGRLTLQLAQTLADQPETRPPGIPIINLTLLPNDIPAVDLTPYIAENFTGLGVTPVGSTAATLLGYDALVAEGSSADSLLFGLMRAVQLPDNRILLVAGRAVEAQRQNFTPLFDAVADSIVLGVGSAPATPTYGVLWNTSRTAADGENAFLDLMGVAYLTNGRLYTADATVGVIELDAQTGDVLATFTNAQLTLPGALAVADDGTVYVGDTLCQCIQVLGADRAWRDPIDGFGVQSPASIAVAPDGSVYATDQADSGVLVQVITGDQRTAIELGVEVNIQPLLALDPAGQVLALTVDGLVLPVAEGDFSALYTLNLPSALVTGFAVDSSSRIVLATADRGVLVVDNTGEPLDALGRLVANFPMPGEFVSPRGVALGGDGTIYITDSDGTFGAVTAMNTRVAAGRIGSSVLIPGVAVQGTLNNTVTQQDWTLVGAAGQTVTLAAVDASETGVLDVRLRLLAPDGSEAAANDDHSGTDLTTSVDAQIAGHVLAASGSYTVRVELVNGSGSYRLGIVQELPFTLNADSPTQLQGTLEGALPRQRWTFEAQGGQVFTITMQTESGTLDPLLRLLDAQGNSIAENDDADDSALGKNAQLVRLQIPADGVYTLETARFSGAGDYTVIIVAVS